ncbi:patatin-like phospholipase family protein [bacterium]|nr:patatin-like phospholipase family protein [bacterium]
MRNRFPAPALLAACILALCVPIARAQSVDEVFPPGDTFRTIAEPISVGGGAFAARLEAVRASGREPLGLVLAGGSARAYAHIGVLRELEKAGVRPDFIVANSMGAVVGMLYAAGMSPDTIAEVVSAVPLEYFFNLVFPAQGGIINADPFIGAIEKLVGRLDLADCPIPIIVTAEDLRTRRQVEISAGDFSRVMAATFAMPAIFEPAVLGDFLLVDGGSCNLVPVDIAAKHSSLLIVSTAFYNKDTDLNNLFSVINRTFDIGKTRAGIQDLVKTSPFVIRNDVEDISYMQFASPGAIVERGGRSAERAMGALLAWLPASARETPPPPALAEARRRYQLSTDGVLAVLGRGGLPPMRPAARLKIRYKLADTFERSPLALDSQAYLGAAAAFGAGPTRATLSSLVGLSQNPGRQWGASAGLLANPFDTVRLGAEARLWGDFGTWTDLPLSPESLEALASVSWTSKGENVVVRPSLSGSATCALDSGEWGWEARMQLALDAGISRGGGGGFWRPFLSARAGGFADTLSGSLRYGPELRLEAGAAKPGLLALRGRAAGRFDLSAQGLALEQGDAYRGNAVSGAAPLVAVANLDLAWLARSLEFSVGEIFLVRDIEIGAYLDSAWLSSGTAIEAPKAFAAGATFAATFSFAGLTPFDLSFFAGLDSAGSPVLGLRADRLFPAIE